MKNIISVIAAFIMFSCEISTKNFPKPDSLKEEICKSINVPFASDLLIYKRVGICGNSSREELNKYYEPHLYKQPYLDILQKRFKGVILSRWGGLCVNKITVSIWGEAIDNNTLKLHEHYQYNDEFQAVEKLFTFNDDKWTFAVTNKIKRVLKSKTKKYSMKKVFLIISLFGLITFGQNKASKKVSKNTVLRQEFPTDWKETIMDSIFEKKPLKKHFYIDWEKAVANPKDVHYLDLSRNKMEKLPAEIGLMTNLISLNLSYNNLKELPKEISQLINLKELVMRRIELRSFPMQICNLKKLEKLNLKYNHISKIPKEIGNLTNLEVLYLNLNGINELPPEIGEITKLTYLNLAHNDIKILPKEIGELKELEQLMMESNQLTNIPKTIGNLENLIRFDLKGNELVEIPAEIGKLKSLKILSLSTSNEDITLPKEIGNLTKLQILIL